MSCRLTPREEYPELFQLVQSEHVFEDSKTFVDATPRFPISEINRAFLRGRTKVEFDIMAFLLAHFDLPEQVNTSGIIDSHLPVEQHVEALWGILTRDADDQIGHSSLIPLPRPYVVPGGRFREIYYWDSYFTMLGLAESGHIDLVQDMVDNFAYLIDEIGFVPNGNRTYYCSRSQPPFFALMVELLGKLRDDEGVCVRYQAQLLREYEFWMSGAEALTDEKPRIRRVVRTEHGLLNRYWDDDATPRQESFAEDSLLAANTKRPKDELFRDLRAACESGWDFSSRWLGEAQTLESIRTTEIMPVDLNALMLNLERRIAKNFELLGDRSGAERFKSRAIAREQQLRTLFFDKNCGMFVDLRLPELLPTGVPSLAAAYPMFFGIATDEQAASTAARLMDDFLRQGGWVTTLNNSGQQWDVPNGWAPLQWIVYRALCRYGYSEFAREGASRWVTNNRVTYASTGRLLEKYDVESIGHAGVGGEYIVQDGFGWTNGVLLRMMRDQVKNP